MIHRMEKYPRDFKGVWIPKEIWLSDQLSLMEKVLFVEMRVRFPSPAPAFIESAALIPGRI